MEAGSAPGSPVCFDARMIIVDDDIVEETEEFMVEIMSVDPPEVIITPGTTSVLIENDDGKAQIHRNIGSALDVPFSMSQCLSGP